MLNFIGAIFLITAASLVWPNNQYALASSIRAEGREVDGLREGLWKTFNSNGKLISEGHYSEGLRDGEWKAFFDLGLSKCNPNRYRP